MFITPVHNKFQNYNYSNKNIIRQNQNSLSFGAKFTYVKLNKSSWYDTYIKFSNEKECEAKVLKTLFDTKFTPQRNINILDIGSGNGLLSKKIITNLSEIYPNNSLNYTAIDNSEKLLQLFTKNCKFKSNKIKIQPVLQDFFAHNNELDKYDYAISAHSMYKNDLIPSIQKTQQALNENGKAFIIRSHPDSIMNYFRDKYHIETDSLKSIHPTKTYLISDLLKETLDSQGIQYKSIEVPYQIKLPNDMESLKKVLSFIIDTPIDNLSSNKLQQLFSDVCVLAKHGKLNCKNNIYVITKE